MSGDSFTPTLDLTKPEVGNSADTWGNKTNSDWDKIDAWATAIAAHINALQSQVDSLQLQVNAGIEAIGTVKFWLSDNLGLTGGTWVQCNGTLYPIATYPTAFSVLGNHWGGDGVSTFGVPDLRGCVLVGLDRGTGRLQGQYGPDRWGGMGGSATITLSVAQLPPHTHSGQTDVQGTHFHDYTVAFAQAPGWYIAGGPGTQLQTVTAQTDWTGEHAHWLEVDSTGGGAPMGNCQVGALGDWIIRIA